MARKRKLRGASGLEAETGSGNVGLVVLNTYSSVSGRPVHCKLEAWLLIIRRYVSAARPGLATKVKRCQSRAGTQRVRRLVLADASPQAHRAKAQ